MSVDIKNGSVWWLYQACRVNTQTNAGGGTLRTRISMPAGMVGRLVSMAVIGAASVTAILAVVKTDEDLTSIHNMAYIAAGASRSAYLPSIGSSAGSNANIADTGGMMIGPGEILYSETSVVLQNETLAVGVVLLLSAPTLPTWDTIGSAGTPSLAASTISAANTLQAVLI